MRTLRFAVAVSAVVHAGVVGHLATRTFALPRAEAPTAQLIEVITVEPTVEPASAPVTQGAALAEDPPAAVIAPPPRTPRVVSRDRAPAAETAAPALPAPPTGEAALPPARPSLMAMRRSAPAGLPGLRRDPLDHPPGPPTPKERESGLLTESGGGTHTSDQGTFVIEVNRDGTVDITDRPSVGARVALPTPRSIGRGLSAWYDSDKGRSGEAADASLSKAIQVTPGATTDPDDPVTTRNRDRAVTAVVPVIGGNLELTDWMMRRAGQDPYASRKLRVLDASRDERARIGARYTADQLRRATQLMQRNLDELWDQPMAPAARKQALFELWDDCAETGEPARVEAGQAARRLVIGRIRARFPAGSPDAFTADELAQLARTKRSTAAFAPYE